MQRGEFDIIIDSQVFKVINLNKIGLFLFLFVM